MSDDQGWRAVADYLASQDEPYRVTSEAPESRFLHDAPADVKAVAYVLHAHGFPRYRDRGQIARATAEAVLEAVRWEVDPNEALPTVVDPRTLAKAVEEARRWLLAERERAANPPTVPCGKCGGPIQVSDADELDLSGAVVVHGTCPRDEKPKRWYEARLAVYEHDGPPPDEFGKGGEKVAHARAVAEAPTFAGAFPHLDRLLGDRWEQLREAAVLADRPEGGEDG